MSLDPKLGVGLGAMAIGTMVLVASQLGLTPVAVTPLPDGGYMLPDGGTSYPDGGPLAAPTLPDGGPYLPDGGWWWELADGGQFFPDGGYWGEVIVTGLNANSSCLNVTGWGDDGGTTPVRVTLLFNRHGLDEWKQGHLPDGGPDWVWALVEFHVYPATLPDGGIDLSQVVSAIPPDGVWMNPDGTNNGDFLIEATPLYPQCEVTFIGYLGTPNSVPFACACSPLVGNPYCVVAVAQPDGGQWNVGRPGVTYGPGQWFPDAGCESKPCFEVMGIGPSSMPVDCRLPDGGG